MLLQSFTVVLYLFTDSKRSQYNFMGGRQILRGGLLFTWGVPIFIDFHELTTNKFVAVATHVVNDL